MKAFLSKLTLIRTVCLLLSILLFWVIISPKRNHSIYHWDIVIILSILIFLLLAIDHFIRKTITKNLKVFVFELVILLCLFGLWLYLIQ